MAEENLSGIPPSVTLSGLDAGASSIGGTAAPGISGSPGQAGDMGGLIPGMEGGLDLATLLQMLQSGNGESGIGSPGSMNQSLAAGSFGQQQGGVSAGSFGQTQPGYVAGQSSAGDNGAMQAAAGSADPFSIIQKYLGVAARGAQAVQGAMTASPTAPQGSGATGGEQQAFTTGIASPVNAGQDLAQSGLFQGGLGGTPSFTDPTLNFLYTSGALNGLSQPQIEQISSLPPDQLEGLRTALLGGGAQSDLGSQLMSGQGGNGFTLGAGGLDTGTPGLGQQSDFLGGGLGLLNGLMNLYGGAKSGSVSGILGGAGGTLGGLEQIAPGLGMGATGSALGGVGGAISLPQTAMGLANAIDDGDALGIATNLASLYGTTVPVINAVFGTALPTLTSAAGSAIASLGSSLGGSVGSALGSLGASIGGGAAAGAGAASAGAGAAAGAGATAGAAGAGGAAAAGTAGLVMAPIAIGLIMTSILSGLDDKEAAREMGIRLKNIQGQMQGEVGQIQSIPGIANQLNQSSTPDEAAGMLKQLNDIQKGFEQGGWESYWKQGQTSVGGGSAGKGVSVELPGVQSQFEQMQPYMQMMNVARLRAEDVLGNAGWSPEQIQQKTGSYIDPIGAALMMNSITPTIANHQSPSDPWGLYQGANFSPTFRSALLPTFMQGELGTAQQWNPEASSGSFADRQLTSADDLAGVKAMGLPTTRSDGTPLMLSDVRNAVGGGGSFRNLTENSNAGYGEMVKSLAKQVNAIKPGQFEAMLPQFLQQYGGVNPYLTKFGFGQGLGAAPQQPISPQIMAAANSPAASTAGAQSYNADGRLTEETLMDILRRMSPGAAYAGV